MEKSKDSQEKSALFAVNMALTAQHSWVYSNQALKSWLAEDGN